MLIDVYAIDISYSTTHYQLRASTLIKAAKFDVALTFVVEGKGYFYLSLVSMISGHLTTI